MPTLKIPCDRRGGVGGSLARTAMATLCVKVGDGGADQSAEWKGRRRDMRGLILGERNLLESTDKQRHANV
jgi:hypothetical protein